MRLPGWLWVSIDQTVLNSANGSNSESFYVGEREGPVFSETTSCQSKGLRDGVTASGGASERHHIEQCCLGGNAEATRQKVTDRDVRHGQAALLLYLAIPALPSTVECREESSELLIQSLFAAFLSTPSFSRPIYVVVIQYQHRPSLDLSVK
ncbi:unnamed protein product [Musa acuminata var. zebrina]